MIKRVIGVVAVVGAVAGAARLGRSVRHRKELARDVRKELRSPVLYAPLDLGSPRVVRLSRKLGSKGVPAPNLPDGVTMRTERLAADADRPDIRVLVYEHGDRPRPAAALLWIHGGGFVMGIPEQDHGICARIADELGMVVVNVEYRLAPEDPFPAGLEDCYTALTWIHEHADELGVDPGRVAVGGASAGGGLAACLAQLAADRDGPPIRFQLLQYPMLDDRTALREHHDAPLWTNASNRHAWMAYLGHPVDDGEERAHAAAARRLDLTGLPPAWIGVGDVDLFHDECVAYADRLRQAGVACDLFVVPGMFHGAEHFAPRAPSMREFVDRMVGSLRHLTAADCASPV